MDFCLCETGRCQSVIKHILTQPYNYEKRTVQAPGHHFRRITAIIPWRYGQLGIQGFL